MADDSPEKKAWLANAAEANAFARAHGGDAMTPENRAIYELMMRRTADARSAHEVIDAAARIIASADGLGMSVAGRWIASTGVALTYVGALWMVLYSVSGGDIPIPSLGDLNTSIGGIVLLTGVTLWIVGAALRRSGRRRAHR